MDKEQEKILREKMTSLLEKSLDNPNLDQTHTKRLIEENGYLFEKLSTVASIIEMYLGSKRTAGKLFLNDISMAYHIYEELTSEKIPYIDRFTIDSFGREIGKNLKLLENHMEDLKVSNPIYLEYVGRVLNSWIETNMVPEEALLMLKDWLVLIPQLVSRQKQKDIVNSN